MAKIKKQKTCSSDDSVLTQIEYFSESEAVIDNSKKPSSPVESLCEEQVIKDLGDSIGKAKANGVVYRSYPERWGLVLTVTLLNVANCAHWISFGSVNSKAAVFYHKKVEDITR